MNENVVKITDFKINGETWNVILDETQCSKEEGYMVTFITQNTIKIAYNYKNKDGTIERVSDERIRTSFYHEVFHIMFYVFFGEIKPQELQPYYLDEVLMDCLSRGVRKINWNQIKKACDTIIAKRPKQLLDNSQ